MVSESKETRGAGGAAREKFRAASHGGVESDGLVDDGVVGIEEGVDGGIHVDRTGKRDDRFAMFAREGRDTGRTFAFQGLAIDAAFTGEDHVAGGNALLEPEGFGEEIETGADPGVAKTEQAEAEATGRAGAGCLAKVF